MDKTELLELTRNLGDALQQQGLLLSLAESCTGGMAASLITEIPGSSTWFESAHITYSNAAKISMLGVNPTTLETYGAVSEQTAIEMAHGALHRGRAHIAAAITGIAGPGGGTQAKPVGTVCFAWATPGHIVSTTRHFSGNRQQIRAQAVQAVFEGLLQLVQQPMQA